MYGQCLFDRDAQAGNTQAITAGDSWAVVAEAEEVLNPGMPQEQRIIHLCKLYRLNCSNSKRYDLRSDPNENTNLYSRLRVLWRKEGRTRDTPPEQRSHEGMVPSGLHHLAAAAVLVTKGHLSMTRYLS